MYKKFDKFNFKLLMSILYKMSDFDTKYIQTMESKLQEIRHDNQVPASAFLEAIDNSVDWGKANSITIVKTNSSISVYDNGHVDDNLERFSEWLAFGKKNNKVYGSDSIGKFGLGLPKGGCLLGDKMSVIALIDGTIMTAQCDWERMIRNNIHKPVVRDSTPEEIQEFKENYGTQGVLVKYENLFESSKELSIEYIHDITCAQFLNNSDKSPHIKLIQVFDDGRESNTIEIKEFVDTTCWESTIDKYKKTLKLVKLVNRSDRRKKKFVIEDKGIKKDVDKDGKLIEQDFSDYDKIYDIEVKLSAIDDKFHAQGSQKLYKNKQDCEIIGAKMYRQGRDITPFTSLNLGNTVSPDNGMYRSKGARITLDFNTKSYSEEIKMKICADFDTEFGVTSLKNIANDAFSNYKTDGQKECLKYIGNCAHKLYENKKGGQKEKAQEEVKKKIEKIRYEPQSISKEECDEFVATFKRLYDEGEYQPDDKDFKEPFKFDGRNGFYKEFLATGYKEITTKLNLILENFNETYEINVESAGESLDEEQHEGNVNSSINESMLLKQVNDVSEQFTQPEQVDQQPEKSTQEDSVNESSVNPTQLELSNLINSSDDDSSSSSEEDDFSSDESDIETAQLLTPENFESENTDSEYFHDSSSSKASIENDIMIKKYDKMFKENICDKLDFSNPKHRALIDEFSQKLNQTLCSMEVSNSI